ncbi:hypothetical protein HIM_05811 [Hirsutella minnesotensis 3608]|uniref:Peptidase A1 domain-containing protein n=1 Tax=Hirsutella minnesotensis 3608 TaxID=1043627 RepID=A0A0F8A546_9HYPO|nr:hypothetical protein HIM_05811 [Hirsutella minnesotensis 3608]
MPSLAQIVPLLLYARDQAADSVAKTASVAIGHLQTESAGPFVPLMNLSLGNPPQLIQTILDTGSSDLIVPSPNSSYCKLSNANCAVVGAGGNGAFDPSKSNGVAETGAKLDTGFVNGETESGKYIKASGTVGNSRFDAFQFGLVEDAKPGDPTETVIPVLGVGPVLSEADSAPRYQNLPAQMKDQGATQANIYGIYVNDVRGNEGTVTFGGIDKAKFKGPLQEAPMVPSPQSQQGNDNDADNGEDDRDDERDNDRNDDEQDRESIDAGGFNDKSQRHEIRSMQPRQVGVQDDRNIRRWRVGRMQRRNLARARRRIKIKNKEADVTAESQGDSHSREGTKGKPTEFFINLSSVSYLPPGQDATPSKDEATIDQQRRKGRDRDNGASDLTPGRGESPILVDTGNPEVTLPARSIRGLARALDAKFDESQGVIKAFDCSKAQGAMRFGFNNDQAVITVPIEMMLVPQAMTKGNGCELAMSASDDLAVGSPFLQSAYAVFDMENKRIMFAQAVPNVTRSEVVAVTADWAGTMQGTG